MNSFVKLQKVTKKESAMKYIFLIIFFIFTTDIYAKDVVALLKSIENNHTFHMSYKNDLFVCKPYGVETVSELALRVDANSTCKKHLNNFIKSFPNERYFAESNLYVQQQYSVEGISGRCLLKFTSGYSYSEALLQNGYARIPLSFQYKDKMLAYRFENSLKKARDDKVGLWSDTDVRNCFLTGKLPK
jgi:hypothetical protein